MARMLASVQPASGEVLRICSSPHAPQKSPNWRLLVAGVALLSFSGCAAILRESLNRRYPPIEPSQHQYATIQRANQALAELSSPPNIYAFLPKNILEAYLLQVLSRPIPLDDEGLKILQAPPQILGTQVEVVPGDITINTSFRATHVSGVRVDGRIEVHASPELLPGGVSSISALRLRLSLSKPQIYRIDASNSRYRGLQIFSEVARSIVSQTLDFTLNNINAVIRSAIVPIPMQPMVVGDDRTPEERAAAEAKENAELDKQHKPHPIRTHIEPPVLARLYPYIKNGAMVVRSEGVLVVGSVGIEDVPKGPLKLPLTPSAQEEPLPIRPPGKGELRAASERMNASSLTAFSQASGTTTLPGTASAGLVVQPLGAAVGGILNGKSLAIIGYGPINEHPEPEPPAKIVIPKIPLYCQDLEIVSCDGHKDVCTAQYSREADRARKVASDGLQRAHDALTTLDNAMAEHCKQVKHEWQETVENCVKGSLWGCLEKAFTTITHSELVFLDPVACVDDKERKAGLEQLMNVDNEILGLAADATANPEERGLALIDRVDPNLGQHYRAVCGQFTEYADRYGCKPLQQLGKDACEQIQKAVDHFQGAKVGDIDWHLTGEGGDHALNFDLRLDNVNIAADFMSATAAVSGRGDANVSGWFKLHFEDAFRQQLCASGQGAEGSLGPAKIPGILVGKDATGTVTFINGDKSPSRFMMSTEPLDITLNTELPPLQMLLKFDNVIFPCPVSDFMWAGVLPLYKTLEWTKTPIPYTYKFG